MAAAKKAARHNQETILFILMGLIIVGLIISGYFLFVKKILPELAATEQVNSLNSTPAQNQAGEEAQAASVFIPDDDAQILTLYFPQKGQDNFRAEARKVRRQKMLTAQAKQIVEELLKGPANIDFSTAIPEGTKLRGLFFDAGTFFVDLSREFASIQQSGPSEELLGVYSIVNSLTEIDPRAKVKFLINGSEQNGEKGHIDLSEPLTRLQEMIVK
ncbi:MAG: hypothetical protein PWR01_2315 [Clostridiales bacterium]|nr:hypothetical protein [Clostridiales bacterium]MDN5281242.1 hypothetical protein [Candidatus Ozemobacter sp.]